MALYNFQKRFVEKILAGEKAHTIRAKRKRRTKPGETLHLYTGLRQKGARLLMRPTCTRVEDILIDIDESIFIDGARLSFDECNQLAKRDGFRDYLEMMKFWDGRRPFEGDVIHWKPQRGQIEPRPHGEEPGGKAREVPASVSAPRMRASRKESKPTVLQQCLLHEGLSCEEPAQVTRPLPTLREIHQETRSSS